MEAEPLIAIDHDIPVPNESTASRRMGPISIAAASLEPGDSFFVEGKGNLGGALYYIRRKYPERKFVTRRQEGGVRIWRKE
jgi:hypothetical protein